MLKIFLTGDNHVGVRYRGHEKGGLLARRRIEAFPTMVKKANEERCDLLVIAGDLFEDRTSATEGEIEEVLRYLADFRGKVAILPGNHDFYDGDSKLWKTMTDLVGRWTNVLLLTEDKPYELSLSGRRVVLYPAPCRTLHSAPGENNLGWIKNEKMDDGAFNIGVAHGALEGLSLDKEGAYFAMTRAELENIPVDAWLIGHVHVPYPKGLEAEFKSAGRIFNAGTHVQDNVNTNTEGLCFIIEIDDEKRVRAKQFVSGNLTFVRREIVLRPGEAESIVEAALADVGPNSSVELTLKGVVSLEEYSGLLDMVDEKLAPFIEGMADAKAVTKDITQRTIDAEFPETSFSAKLITALLGDRTETQLAYDLLEELKGGAAK